MGYIKPLLWWNRLSHDKTTPSMIHIIFTLKQGQHVLVGCHVKREFITEPSSLSTCKELGHQRPHALEHPTAPPPVLAASPHVIVLTEGTSHMTLQCCDWGLWNLGHAELSLRTSPKESSSYNTVLLWAHFLSSNAWERLMLLLIYHTVEDKQYNRTKVKRSLRKNSNVK